MDISKTALNEYERVPPQDIYAEQGVLASCLVAPGTAIAECAQAGLTAEDFYLAIHRYVFTSIMRVWMSGKQVDLVSIHNDMAIHGTADVSGGAAFLGELLSDCPSSPNPKAWAESLVRLSGRRHLIAVSANITNRAFDIEDEDVLETAAQEVLTATQQRLASRCQKVSAFIPGFLKNLELAQKNGTPGLSTGLEAIDALTGGLFPSDFIIIGGRPSMGKTALATKIATNCARNGVTTLFFSLEMSSEQLTQRLFSDRTKASLHKIRTGKLAQRELPMMAHAAGEIDSLPLHIDDTPHIGLAHARAVMMAVKPRLVVLDYIQLANGFAEKGASRQQEMGTLSRGFKTLAKEFRIPIIALAQLSRAVDQRGGDHVPMLSDLREAGDLEQDADGVWFCYRGEYYFPNKQELKGKAEIIVAKQRNGPPGIATLAWHGDCATFENIQQQTAEWEVP